MTKTIKVLHICSGDVWGGSETQVSLLVKNKESVQSTLNTDFSVLLFNHGDFANHLKDKGIFVHVVEEQYGFRCLYINTKAKFSQNPPDLIVAHGYKEALIGFLLSKKFKIPWILNVHGGTENHSGINYFKIKFYKFLELILAKFSAKKIIFVSHELKESMGFSNNHKSVVIHNATDMIPDNTSTQKEDTNNNMNLRVTWIGRMNKIKRPELFIYGASQFQKNSSHSNNIDFEIAGDGPLLPEIKELSSKLEIRNIHFHGFINNVFSFYQKGSILVMTSDHEGIPTVILEAIQFGMPVVTRSVGGIPEIFNKLNEYPYFLIEDDPKSISDILHYVVENYFTLHSRALSLDTSYFLEHRMQEEHKRLYLETLS